ncbi:MAG: hypothetical protein B7Z52_07575, partial [Burkholderiales bacterium 12-64-5]
MRPLKKTHEPELAGPFPPDLHDVRHLWLKGGLLLLWVLVSFVATFFARDLQFRLEYGLLRLIVGFVRLLPLETATAISAKVWRALAPRINPKRQA